MARSNSWAAPQLPPRDFVCVDGWGHNRPPHALRFSSTTGRPAIRVILDAELEFEEAERLMGEVLNRLFEPGVDGGE